MRKQIIGYAMFMILSAGCNDAQHNRADDKQTSEVPSGRGIAEREPPTANGVDSAGKGETLVYQNSSFSSYTESVRRGKGVISFTLDVNDRLDIWNMDGSKFGEIVLNEDFTYFTLNMPKKVIARKLVPEYDFAAFDFDGEETDSDKDFLLIYVNKEKREVSKSEVKFTFTPWK